jgi:hypothetical protein
MSEGEHETMQSASPRLGVYIFYSQMCLSRAGKNKTFAFLLSQFLKQQLHIEFRTISSVLSIQ